MRQNTIAGYTIQLSGKGLESLPGFVLFYSFFVTTQITTINASQIYSIIVKIDVARCRPDFTMISPGLYDHVARTLQPCRPDFAIVSPGLCNDKARTLQSCRPDFIRYRPIRLICSSDTREKELTESIIQVLSNRT